MVVYVGPSGLWRISRGSVGLGLTSIRLRSKRIHLVNMSCPVPYEIQDTNNWGDIGIIVPREG